MLKKISNIIIVFASMTTAYGMDNEKGLTNDQKAIIQMRLMAKKVEPEVAVHYSYEDRQIVEAYQKKFSTKQIPSTFWHNYTTALKNSYKSITMTKLLGNLNVLALAKIMAQTDFDRVSIAKIFITSMGKTRKEHSKAQEGFWFHDDVRAVDVNCKVTYDPKTFSQVLNQYNEGNRVALTIDSAKDLKNIFSQIQRSKTWVYGLTLDMHAFRKKGSKENKQELGHFLKSGYPLRHLDLENCYIGMDGVTPLAEALKVNTSLNFLNLSWNNLDVDEIKVLSQSLKQNKNLHTLELRQNIIRDHGAVYLFNMLENNTTLESLDLGRSCIKAPGVYLIISSLQTNNTLKSLSLFGNEGGEETVSRVAQMLNVNSALRELIFPYCPVTNEDARTLAEALKRNNSIKRLNFRYHKLKDEQLKILQEVTYPKKIDLVYF